MKSKVLVLGTNSRSCLTIVRSLGRKGIDVHLAWYDNNSIVPYSRYVKAIHKVAPYGEDKENWCLELKNLLEKENFDLVVPNDDRGVRGLRDKFPLFSKFSKLALLNERAFEYTYDKNKTYELAKELSIPVPKQMYVSNIEAIQDIEQNWDFPLVIKPQSSTVDYGNKLHSFRVDYAKSKDELFSKLKKLLNFTGVMVQEYFIGTGVGVEFLANKGSICAAFQHVRIHEPMTGGGSSYRKSVPLDKKLLCCVERIVDALDLTGVAMAEFKYNFNSGNFVLIEVNGRFWGSLPLSVSAGMDFPYYLYELLVNGKSDYPQTYRYNMYCRNLLKDISWLGHNLKTKANPYNNAKPLKIILWEPLNILLLRERSDTFVFDDLRPGFVELWIYLKKIFRVLNERLKRIWLSSKMFKRLHLKKSHTIKQINSIAFICKGNICRSPFAEFYARNLLKNQVRNIKVESFGYFPKYNRPCPYNAVEVARKFGVDLSNYRSKIASDDILSEFDIIFVFDENNYHKIYRTFKKLSHKLLFLGVISKSERVKMIKDPYSKDIGDFIETYKLIGVLLDQFFLESKVVPRKLT